MNALSTYHNPALLTETLDGLNIRPDGIYVDATLGGGGHSKAILNRLNDKGRLFGFDQDEDAEENIPRDARFTFVRSNFRYLITFLDWYGVTKIDGMIGDLGVSSHHFDDETRGFSFRFDGKLDMRMNKRAEKTAADILNTYSEEQLADVFYLYGELRTARAIAKSIVRKRTDHAFEKISDLLDTVKPFFSREKEKKQLAQAFQALRIEVNNEMDALKELLLQSLQILTPGGRIAVITYHSLEDRIVKNFFKTGNFEGKIVQDFYGNIQSSLKVVNNKAIVPTDAEIEQNPRVRSAKLRIAEKL
ncbi:MAG: 16S rRNA (cytosine(1402)-N(4))-methyltransferase RsmH [Candidatus Symbiothrix sp.]|jgi:16S rRNA (cytosine1402-N4)-methyltransferase|nr:16S rRNA (cytosine(1402)-N(4))-methyltransferase RsmH [Candidatus Symbiothrix sp.]